MNKTSISHRLAGPALLAGAIILVLGGCQRSVAADSHNHAAAPASAAAPAPAKQLYQCPMHPNVVSDHPGRCPICGMELQPIKAINAQGIPGRAPVELTDQQAQLINLRTAAVTAEPLTQTLRVAGYVAVNEEKTATLNSRVEGWVQKLYVNQTGAAVRQGEPLLSIYSPALLATQQDFLTVYRRAQHDPSYADLLAASRQRLELWGISAAQIQQLAASGQPLTALTLDSPLNGTVMTKSVEAQQMVSPGMPLYQIADLSTLWVQAEVYESELPLVSPGAAAVVTVPAYPDRQWTGRVDFIYPTVQDQTRTTRVRIAFPNPDGLLKPGMFVNVTLHHDLGRPLSVPASAVFNTGLRQYVFVERQPGIFVPVLVELGPRVEHRQVIRGGLQAGDLVVVDGNFLLDSESQLRAAADSSVSPANATMPGMDMSATPAAPPAQDSANSALSPSPAPASAAMTDLLSRYESLHQSLARDQLDGVAPALAAMRATLDHLPAAGSSMAPALDALRASLGAAPPASLMGARIQFGRLSAALIAYLHTHPAPLPQPLYILHCPMWQKSPADWLQTTATVANPFYGPAMSSCGVVTGQLGPHQP